MIQKSKLKFEKTNQSHYKKGREFYKTVRAFFAKYIFWAFYRHLYREMLWGYILSFKAFDIGIILIYALKCHIQSNSYHFSFCIHFWEQIFILHCMTFNLHFDKFFQLWPLSHPLPWVGFYTMKPQRNE
jgi:hypothetical protein